MTGLIPVRRRGRPKKADAIDRQNIGPTPETAAKLEPDQLSGLLARGQISPDQERAGRRLHSLSLALQRGMSPRALLQTPTSSSGRKKAKSPLERMTEREQEHWMCIYRPWADASSRKVVWPRPKLTLMGLTARIVEENQSLGAVASDFGFTEDRALDALREGLESYIAQEKAKKRL